MNGEHSHCCEWEFPQRPGGLETQGNHPVLPELRHWFSKTDSVAFRVGRLKQSGLVSFLSSRCYVLTYVQHGSIVSVPNSMRSYHTHFDKKRQRWLGGLHKPSREWTCRASLATAKKYLVSKLVIYFFYQYQLILEPIRMYSVFGILIVKAKCWWSNCTRPTCQ